MTDLNRNGGREGSTTSAREEEEGSLLGRQSQRVQNARAMRGRGNQEQNRSTGNSEYSQRPRNNRTSNQVLRIGTYNVRGLRRRATDVQHIFLLEKLDVMALQETFLSPEQSLLMPYRAELISNAPSQPGYRSAGGSAIIFRNSIDYELVMKDVIEQCEVILIRTGEGILA